jgi:ribosomal protein S18 acetylase RimI-like enzyme
MPAHLNARIEVSSASLQHASLLTTFGREAFIAAFEGQIENRDLVAFADKRYGTAQQQRELSDPNAVFFMARVDGELAGYAKLYDGDPPPVVSATRAIELERLYLSSKWFGSGVALSLLNACVGEARDRSHDVMWLDVWDGNARAQAFYRKHGFDVIGERPYDVGSITQRHLLMRRTLATQ